MGPAPHGTCALTAPALLATICTLLPPSHCCLSSSSAQLWPVCLQAPHPWSAGPAGMGGEGGCILSCSLPPLHPGKRQAFLLWEGNTPLGPLTAPLPSPWLLKSSPSHASSGTLSNFGALLAGGALGRRGQVTCQGERPGRLPEAPIPLRHAGTLKVCMGRDKVQLRWRMECGHRQVPQSSPMGAHGGRGGGEEGHLGQVPTLCL